jgi:hypothetical protein
MQTDTPTVAHVFERAAALTDPDAHDEIVAALVERFEDDERPARGVDDFEQLAWEAVGREDPEGDSPAGQMTAAAATWLVTNPGQDDDQARVLREAARLAYHGDPPPAVAGWLAELGIEAAR